MHYYGLDLRRRSSRFCELDEKREVVREGNVDHTPQQLRRRFGKDEPMRFVLEATTASFWVADRLTELGHDVRVSTRTGRRRSAVRSSSTTSSLYEAYQRLTANGTW